MAKMFETRVTDLDTGELLAERVSYGAFVKGGWLMMFTNKTRELLLSVPNASTLKVFMYLALGQTYEGGMKTTKRAIEQNLHLSHKTVSQACAWLLEKQVIHEWRFDGCVEFLVSPVYVNVGKFDERVKLWNQRWAYYRPIYKSAAYQKLKSAEFEAQRAALARAAADGAEAGNSVG